MSFVPTKAKAKKQMAQTGLFVLSSLLQSFKLYLGCLQSVGQKVKTPAQRRRYGQTFGRDANTLTHQLRGWSMMNDVWAREVALHYGGGQTLCQAQSSVYPFWSPTSQQRQWETMLSVNRGA